MSFSRRRHSIVLTICIFASGFSLADDLSPSARRMLDDVKTLASDEYEGRGIGTKGLERAAEFIAKEFENAGLNVQSAGGDPYQEFEVTDGAELGETNSLTLNGPDGTKIELKIDESFQVCSFGAAGNFSAPVVFAGYGIDAPDVKYNDFENVDVEGKVVIIMRRTPLQSDPHGPFAVGHGISRHAALTTKLSQAFTKGAVAVLYVNDPFSGRSEKNQLSEKAKEANSSVIDLARKLSEAESPSEELLKELRTAVIHNDEVTELFGQHDPDPLMNFGYAGTRAGKSIPCFHVKQDVVDQMLLKSAKTTLAELEVAIDETGLPASQELEGWTVTGEASLELVRQPVKNVVGVLEGAGPHKDETIVIGAHFDHLGFGGEGSLLPNSKDIHNGADDNASGTAGLIELARRLSSRDQKLPRRVVFVAFTGEERGLLGSEEYVKDPVVPLKQTVAMLNMDMIGRLDEDKLTVFGTGTSPVWDPLIDGFADDLSLKLSKKPEGFGPSDHSTFYAKQIPVLHLFTGTHSDYHRPSDDWDKINADGMDRIVTFLERIATDVAKRDDRPEYIQVKGTAILARTGSRPYFGSIPDFGTDAEGYAIQGVSPDSPADKGGLKGGDIIINFGGNRIGSLDDFDLALRKFSAGEQVDVIVMRDGKEVPLKVTLATPRG